MRMYIYVHTHVIYFIESLVHTLANTLFQLRTFSHNLSRIHLRVGISAAFQPGAFQPLAIIRNSNICPKAKVSQPASSWFYELDEIKLTSTQCPASHRARVCVCSVTACRRSQFGTEQRVVLHDNDGNCCGNGAVVDGHHRAAAAAPPPKVHQPKHTPSARHDRMTGGRREPTDSPSAVCRR